MSKNKKAKVSKPTPKVVKKPMKKMVKPATSKSVASKSTASKSVAPKATSANLNKKISISLRVDPGVLDWFKKQGKGYQTLMNSVLGMHVENSKAAKKAAKAVKK